MKRQITLIKPNGFITCQVTETKDKFIIEGTSYTPDSVDDYKQEVIKYG